MLKRSQPSIAVIADAHFHDLEGDFDFPGMTIDGPRMMVRSWAETRQSTRVFNESARALSVALDEVRDRGIRHVVLLGDYTDDGQRQTTASLRRILDRHANQHGTAFYALPGNHDIFGPRGRHHTKEFLDQDGAGVWVTSDPASTAEGAIVTPRMYCEGYPAGLDSMAAYGYFRKPEYLHWETPFGLSDDIESRRYEVDSPDGSNRYSLMDASYLVEPEPGIWLLMIDANVFEPRDGTFINGEEAAFVDSTAAGWNAMLRLKPFIVSWITDVCARAKALGKTVLAFSHYPALDPFDGATGAERVLFGETNVARRTPRQAVTDALLGAGLSVHFSGHLHVEGVTRRGRGERQLTNVAVPSLVAYPPAFKVIQPATGGIVVNTVELSATAVDPRLPQAYRRETERLGEAGDVAFDAVDYGAFLRAHKLALVYHRYFPKEWPQDVVSRVSAATLADVCVEFLGAAAVTPALHALAKSSGMTAEQVAACGMIDVIADWYCLRQAGFLALPAISQERLRLYRALSDRFGREPEEGWNGSVASFLSIFLGAFAAFLDRAENGARQIEITLQPEAKEVV
ncbi:metallophosphoesterase family protein [Ensifer sp. LC163]|uniref:metallophosphoesterase family protein n=1 Tax=Ensifer sp. LC163 TaxID=1120652 RepID=UPI0008135931|nr:metallophosphoesterase [Ensifer sp. LC163]OCP35566.1 metallophosphoesterase [Ensifer sp. LC163]